MEKEKVCKECGATNPVSRMTCQVCGKKLGKAVEKAAAKKPAGKNPFEEEKDPAPVTTKAAESKKDASRSEAAKKAWETKKKAARSRKKHISHRLTMNSFKGTLLECSCGAYMKVDPCTTAYEIERWYRRHAG